MLVVTAMRRAAPVLMTVAETADYLKCSQMAIYHRIFKRTIPHTHLGSRVYILRDELIREMERNAVRIKAPKEEQA
jgi:excisionase family DNA binding protein